MREISDIEFQRELSPVQQEQIQVALSEIVASSRYNTFNLVEPIFDEYPMAIKEGRIVSLAEIIERQDIEENDDNENSIMCAGMAIYIKKD